MNSCEGVTQLSSIALIGQETVTALWSENNVRYSKPVAKSCILHHFQTTSRRSSIKTIIFCFCFTILFVWFTSALHLKYKNEFEVVFSYILFIFLGFFFDFWYVKKQNACFIRASTSWIPWYSCDNHKTLWTVFNKSFYNMNHIKKHDKLFLLRRFCWLVEIQCGIFPIYSVHVSMDFWSDYLVEPV